MTMKRMRAAVFALLVCAATACGNENEAVATVIEPPTTTSAAQTTALPPATTTAEKAQATSAETTTTSAEPIVATEPEVTEVTQATTEQETAATTTTTSSPLVTTTAEVTTTTAPPVTTTTVLLEAVETTAEAAQPARNYDMDDPNVKKYPVYVTAKTAKEFQAGMVAVGKLSWQSAAEIIAHQKSPDNMIDGMTFYEWRMKSVQEWVDDYVAANGLSYKNKSDYEKTEIIRHIVESGRLEEFIGLWQPGFQHNSRDCAVRSNAVIFLMIAMNFEMFDNVSGLNGSTAHAWNAYWDSGVSAVRFLDANLNNNVWNLYVDELDEWNFILD